jgi:Protein of unknown function (DUF3085)
MHLHFDRKLVEELLDHTETAKIQRPLYSHRPKQPTIWVVGDDGIFLMSGGSDPKVVDGLPVVCYARECNPRTMPFDDWWAVKNEVWGGDDTIETFTAVEIRDALVTYGTEEELIIDVGGTGIGLVAYRTVLRPAPRSTTPPRRSRKRQVT